MPFSIPLYTSSRNSLSLSNKVQDKRRKKTFDPLSHANKRRFLKSEISHPRPNLVLLCATSTNTLSQNLQHGFGILPVNASIRDTDTILETGLALCGDLLVAYERLV
jgi:hypothetical protein